MTCPKCGEAKAHRSHRSGFKDYVLRYFNQIPYRCRACSSRFYAYRSGEESPKMRSSEERKIMELRRKLRWKKTKKELLAYGAGLIMIGAVIYMLIQQRIPQN
jgi:hypothetical protein